MERFGLFYVEELIPMGRFFLACVRRPRREAHHCLSQKKCKKIGLITGTTTCRHRRAGATIASILTRWAPASRQCQRQHQHQRQCQHQRQRQRQHQCQHQRQSQHQSQRQQRAIVVDTDAPVPQSPESSHDERQHQRQRQRQRQRQHQRQCC